MLIIINKKIINNSDISYNCIDCNNVKDKNGM